MTTPNTVVTAETRHSATDTADSTEKFQVFLFGNRFTPGFLRQLVVYSLLIILVILFLVPFYWMVNTALKPVDQVFDLPPTWYPNPIRWVNFVDAIATSYEARPPVYIYAMNTAIITISSTIGTTLSSALVAYAFARLEFPGKNVMFLGVLSTMMIPFAVVMVPQFIIFKQLNWLDTLWPLTIPHWFGSAWNIFLLRQFFMTIPKEYDEAAIMDGASHWQIFWRIIMPLSRPALAAVGVFAFVFFWNDFLAPLIILSTPKRFTLTIYLANFNIDYAGAPAWNLYMAAALVIILPCLLLFFFTQKTFLKGITITDFKR